MYRVAALLFCAGCVYAQASRPPQEVLKEAVTAQKAGHLDLAVKDYRLLLQQYPNIPEIRSNLGAALAAQGQYAEAIREYERSLAIKPNPQILMNLALAYYKTGDLAPAVQDLKKVHQQEPANQQVILLLADCYLRLGQNKDVVTLLTPVQSAHPDNRAYNYLLGTALVRDGQTAKGQVVIDTILKNGDSAEARLLMGTTKYMVSDFAGARSEIQKAIELNPNLPDVYSYYGLALLSTGDQAGARKAFQRELASDPNNFDANLRMGVLLRQDEDNDTALKYLRHALLVRPGDPGVRYQIASIEVSQGQLEKARQDLESLVKSSPNFIEAHVSLATVYFREKKKEEGMRERHIVAQLNAKRAQVNEIAAKAQQKAP